MSKQNDQRANEKNPNNPAFKAAHGNTSNQLNSNHLATKTESTAVPAKTDGAKSK